MWLELKALFTVGAIFIIAIIAGLQGNMIYGLLCIMAIGTMIAGDVVIGWKLVNTDAINLIDPTGPGEIIIDLFCIGGQRRFIKARKGPMGKYEFVYHHKKASVIDDGSYPERLPNGNPAISAHESYDKNINWYKNQYLADAFKQHKVDNIKDLYEILKQEELNGTLQ